MDVVDGMDGREKPLSGLRILEAAIQYSAPYPMKLLAAMGAEVIKLEGMARPCGLRFTGPFPDNVPGEVAWDRCGYFLEVDTGKYGVAVDLAQPEGREIFVELVRRSDAVVENFTPRVLRKFGLDYERLRQIKPDLIMVSISGFGHTGPWSDYTAYGMNIEVLTGSAAVTGYPGQGPTRNGLAHIDDIASLHAAFALLSALEHRDETGEGQWIDLGMYEGGAVIPEAVLEYQMNGRLSPRIGNRHAWHAPHGIYPCLGNDDWVALACESDADWQALCRAMGGEDLATDERFAGSASRWQHREELDPIVTEWTGGRTAEEVTAALQSAGVVAGPVLKTVDLLMSPHLKEREFFQVLDSRDDGEHPVGARPYPGVPWRLSGTARGYERPGPGLGEHNHHVLRELLGFEEERIAELERRGVIGTVPASAAVRSPVVAPVEALCETGKFERYDPDYLERLSQWFGQPIGGWGRSGKP